MNLYRTQSIERLPALLRQIRRGDLLVSALYRSPSQWRVTEQLDLCDSIRLGLPIGAVTILRAVRGGKPATFILDGRSRLMSLRDMLTTGGLRVGISTAESNAPFSVIGADTPATTLPLDTLFSDEIYETWRASPALTKANKNRAKRIRTAFIDYLIPIITVITSDSSTIATLFMRLHR